MDPTERKDVHVKIKVVRSLPSFDTSLWHELECTAPRIREENYIDALRRIKANEWTMFWET